jgi:hypothetical protein
VTCGKSVAIHNRVIKAASVCALLCAACSHDDAPTAADPWPTVFVTGAVIDINTNPIGGAAVCVLDHPEIACTTTDSTGSYTLEIALAPSTDVAIEANASGFVSGVLLTAIAASDPSVQGIATTELSSPADATTEYATQAGFAFPGSGGFVEVFVVGLGSAVDGLAGATVAIAPSSGEGPVYRGSNASPEAGLAATTAQGGALFGNVAAGSYSVEVTAPGLTCTTPVDTWPTDAAGNVPIEIADGAVTALEVIACQ